MDAKRDKHSSFKVNLIDSTNSTSYDFRNYCPRDYAALIYRVEFNEYWCPVCGYLDNKNKKKEEEADINTDDEVTVSTVTGIIDSGKGFQNMEKVDASAYVIDASLNRQAEAQSAKVAGAARLGEDRDLQRLREKGYSVISSFEVSSEEGVIDPTRE